LIYLLRVSYFDNKTVALHIPEVSYVRYIKAFTLTDGCIYIHPTSSEKYRACIALILLMCGKVARFRVVWVVSYYGNDVSYEHVKIL